MTDLLSKAGEAFINHGPFGIITVVLAILWWKTYMLLLAEKDARLKDKQEVLEEKDVRIEDARGYHEVISGVQRELVKVSEGLLQVNSRREGEIEESRRSLQELAMLTGKLIPILERYEDELRERRASRTRTER